MKTGDCAIPLFIILVLGFVSGYWLGMFVERDRPTPKNWRCPTCTEKLFKEWGRI